MSAHYYHLCCKNIGRPVEIRTRDGRVHRGMITHVDNRNVYVRPFGGGRNLGGFGFGFWRPWGFGVAAFGIGVAFGSIATLAFLPFFWW
ncbi:MAG TPA: hypothetical protein GX497_00995 [Bacillus bacterium]|nr:hypothetical protein [Bacillus sp. (in: firmicutes)]